MSALTNLLIVALPYLAVVLCVIGCIYRYRVSGFKFSSLSSQFLDSDKLFFGSMLFHWGLLVVLAGHLLAFLFPGWVLHIYSSHANLVIFEEMIGFTFGLGALLGLVWLFIRRMGNQRVRVVTSRMDIFIEVLLIFQIALGCWIAYAYRWGSTWFASNLSPYLWSLFKLDPQTAAVVSLPAPVLIHIVAAFVILALIPFSRLVHFLVAPFTYIARPYQQVIWNWDRKRIRDPNTAWSNTRPKNN
ncbi:Respiratory nitrate reductase gamma chain [Georgfuchsia toluolica]|uniref:Respiratory nitrate reductase gamma chain n=1 Tax=Georgfuchsia toluolica TaxID=424218 RepID=A0A916J559_9PROT|nr:respiratory nitrate reductase subunit gamma [Georgfuchsia toluolica]CAG4884193.1 Respiratory nitrate reductase gamma chain [Georgfuchsia toluolica]